MMFQVRFEHCNPSKSGFQEYEPNVYFILIYLQAEGTQFQKPSVTVVARVVRDSVPCNLVDLLAGTQIQNKL